MVLNEYATGSCVVAGAFIRYVLVCHPTKPILTNRVLKLILVFLLSISVLTVVGNVIDMRYNFHSIDKYHKKYHLSPSRLFLYNCEAFQLRQPVRLAFDASVCLGIPAVISAYFYFSIATVLRKRDKDASRNATLALSFALSWLLWILCWTPNYVLMYIFRPSNWTSMNTDTTKTLTYLRLSASVLRGPLQMLYSHLNPLVFIIVLRPFKEFLLLTLQRGFLKLPPPSEQSHLVPKMQTNLKYGAPKFIKLCGRISIIIVIAYITVVFIVSILLEKGITDVKIQRKQEKLSSDVSFKGELKIGFLDLLPPSVDPNLLCAVNHGKFEAEYRRCFFVMEHGGDGLNITEQNSACETKLGTLSYPRSDDELSLLWNTYQKYRKWGDDVNYRKEDTWFLHLGFRPRSKTKNDLTYFTSFDGKLNISNHLASWFRGPERSIGLSFTSVEFKGPVACMTKLTSIYTLNRPYECLPGTKRKFSICSIDYSRNRDVDVIKFLETNEVK